MTNDGQAFVPPKGWERFPDRATSRQDVSVWCSASEHDPLWDDFLLNTQLGQFQQSSAWARVKQLEGWQATRFIVTVGDRVVGGFQILWKSKFGFRFGYVSKGPVVVAVPEYGPGEAIDLLRRATRHLRLWALVAQPPDFANDLEERLVTAGYLENRLQAVFDATVLVELSDDFAEVERRYSPSTRKQLRKAAGAGVRTQFAASEGSNQFFDLMVQTCKRHGVDPNPSHPDSIRRIIDEFCSRQSTATSMEARIAFAEMDGTILSGLLVIRFGETVSLWKTGWSGSGEHLNPTKLLYHESLRWAARVGCHRVDLVGFDRGTAVAVLEGNGQEETKMKSTDILKLRFGGRPMLLPRARIWIPSPVVRYFYKALMSLR